MNSDELDEQIEYQCSDCGGDVSRTDDACPHCGGVLEPDDGDDLIKPCEIGMTHEKSTHYRPNETDDSHDFEQADKRESIWVRLWYVGLLPALLLVAAAQLVILFHHFVLGSSDTSGQSAMVFALFGLGMGALTRRLRGVLIGINVGALLGLIQYESLVTYNEWKMADLRAGEAPLLADTSWFLLIGIFSSLPYFGLSVASRWMPADGLLPWRGVLWRGGVAFGIGVLLLLAYSTVLEFMFPVMASSTSFSFVYAFLIILGLLLTLLPLAALLYRNPLIARPLASAGPDTAGGVPPTVRKLRKAKRHDG